MQVRNLQRLSPDDKNTIRRQAQHLKMTDHSGDRP